MFRSLFLTNLLVVLLFDFAFSQKKDSVRADSVVKHSYVPTGIRVGTDLISLVKTQSQNDFRGWEVNADIDFYRYYFNIDYGSWGRTFSSDSGSYSNDGTYWRTGIDVNFLKKDPDRNLFFIGFRYGRANFSENLTVIANNPFLNPPALVTNEYAQSGINARWFELTTGLRVKIYKIFWMGYTARFKFGLKYDNSEQTIPADVPGYGRTDKDSYWGFNYQIFIRIPLRKQPVLLPEKKK